jgi:hypothetical protein
MYYMSETDNGERKIEVAKKVGDNWIEVKLPVV